MTEWRKHDVNFLQNAKIVEATEAAGYLAPLLALAILDINAIGDRRGTLNGLESKPSYLRRRLIGLGLDGITEQQVTAALRALSDAGFLDDSEPGVLSLPGWSDDEFGVRGRPPRPKGLRACDQCGSDFQPQRKDHRFCSSECRKKSHEAGRGKDPDASDGRSDASPDGRSDASDGEKERRKDGRIDGVPPNPPSGGGESFALNPDGEPKLSGDDAAEESAIDEMVAICRVSGVRMARFPLRRALRAFHGSGGSPGILRDLSALASTGGDPAALLVHWLEDPYRWKSALDDRDADAKHRAAMRRGREAAAEADYRAENGLPADGEATPKMRALRGGVA